MMEELDIAFQTEVVGAVQEGDEVVLSTRQGMAIRFSEADARAMGRGATGVWGIKMKAGADELVGMVVADPDGAIAGCAASAAAPVSAAGRAVTISACWASAICAVKLKPAAKVRATVNLRICILE